MPTDSAYLFVYGTLLDKENEFGALLLQNSTFVTDGRLRGKLYDLGEYPGAVVVEDMDNWVYGSVYSIRNPEVTLKILDRYEGFGDDFLQPNLFVRERVKVETIANMLECWVYLYNLSVDGLRHITSVKYF